MIAFSTAVHESLGLLIRAWTDNGSEMELLKAFKHFDTHQTGRICFRKTEYRSADFPAVCAHQLRGAGGFTEAVNRFMPSSSKAEVAALFTKYDANRLGKVDYKVPSACPALAPASASCQCLALHRPVANASLCFRKEFVSAVFGKKVGAAQIFKHAAQLNQPRSDRPPPSAYPRDEPIRATPAADAEEVEALYDCRLTSRPHRIGRYGASGHRLVYLLTRRVCLSVAATASLRRRTEGTSYKPMHRPCCLLIPTGKAQAHPGAKVASHTTPTVEVTT